MRRSPAPICRALVLAGLAAGLGACAHEEPFEPESPGGTTPIAPGPAARLTLDAGPDEWPAWSGDGRLLYTYRSNTGDFDRCVGVLPATGGQRTTEWCSNYPGNRDTTDLWSPAALGADGRLAVLLRRKLPGGLSTLQEELRLGRLEERTEASTTLVLFPYPGPDGRPVSGVTHLQWTTDGRLLFVLEERIVTALCVQCPLDTLYAGRGVALHDGVTPGQPAVLPGTALASSVSLAPGGTDAWYTVIGDTTVYAVPLGGGSPTVVAALDSVGVVRDVVTDGQATYVIAGGSYQVFDTEAGPMVRDGGGIVYRLDPAGGAPVALTPLDGPYYRRPALAPDGRHLVAERGGDLWLLELP